MRGPWHLCGALLALMICAQPQVGLAQQGGTTSLQGGTGASQSFAEGRVQSPILTIESDRLFAESAFGRRIAREIEAERDAIAQQNDRITAELEAEEQALTDLRAETPVEAFRELADAFDAKVQRLRREQDEKARTLGTRNEEARRRFVAAAQPVIEAIMRDTGAALIVERRIVFISADVIDITDAAIARIDAAIGDGTP